MHSPAFQEQCNEQQYNEKTVNAKCDKPYDPAEKFHGFEF
jgi:hypothetical protein